MEFSKLPASLRAYILVHLVLVVPVLWLVTRQAAPSQWGVVAFLMAATVLCATWKLELTVYQGRMSVVFAIVSLALLLQGTQAAVLCAALGAIITTIVRVDQGAWRVHIQRQPLHRLLFNPAHCALVCALAGALFEVVRNAAPGDWAAIVSALVVFTTAYFLLNSFGISAAVAMQQRLPVLGVWRENFLWMAPGFLAYAFAAAGIWLTFRAVGPWALLFVPPIYAVYYSHWLYLDRLQKANASLREQIEEREREQAARAESEAARQRFAFLAEVSDRLASSLDYHVTLEQIARLLLPQFADWCVVDLVEEPGGTPADQTIRAVAVAHVDPVQEELAAEVRRQHPPAPSTLRGVFEVLRSGNVQHYPSAGEGQAELSREAGHRTLVEVLGARSFARVPLAARGRIFGVLSLGSPAPDRYTDDDLALLEEVGRRAALAVDNARLYQEVRRQEQQKEEALARLDALLSSGPVGVAFLDRDLRFIRVNQAMAEIAGVPVEAHIDRPLAEVLPHLAPESEPILGRVLDTGEPFLDQEITLPVPGKPGHHRKLLANRYPVRKRDGEIVGVGVALVDITERKRAEEELRSVTEHARCILFYADVEEQADQFRWQTRVSDDNAAQQVLPLVVEPGKTYQDAWVAARHPDDHLRMRETAARAIRNGESSYCQEYRARDRFGNERWLFEDVYLEERGAGRWRAVGVCTDITERKGLEERLKEADRRKDEFLAMLAHELRNPLAAICNASYVLERAQVGRPDYQRLLAIVGRQSHHLSRLVDDLLDVSRITHGKIELRKEPCELRTVVQRAADGVRNQMERRSHALHLELPERGLMVEADPARLEQVIVNLLGNAAKYTEDGGQVWLSVSTELGGPEAEWASIHIRDTGVGIAPHLLPQVFEMFTQADRSLDRAQGGLGIGLTLVRNLVELHGGTVSAHSDGIGCGSEFIVRLPLVRNAAERHGLPPDVEGRRGIQTRRILVVEDNADAAETLVDILELWGHAVRVAPSGEEALSLLPQYRPEVVLLDIGLPGMDGYEVARHVRHEGGRVNDSGGEPLLIALTGYGQEEDRRRSGEAGFDRHLTKPVNPEELRRVLLADEE